MLLAAVSAPVLRGVIPHDPGAFTQGLEYRNDILWETTGVYGSSTFRATSPLTGEVIGILQLPDSVFAEGLTFINDSTAFVLTWREGTAYLIDTGTMAIAQEFTLENEGWGLALAGDTLWQSNGSSMLYMRDKTTFALMDSVEVTLNGIPQGNLNELEFTGGLILANQWQTSRILFINRHTGTVERVLNLSDYHPGTGGVLNGIAAGDNGELFCTGKNWPVTLIIGGLDSSD